MATILDKPIQYFTLGQLAAMTGRNPGQMQAHIEKVTKKKTVYLTSEMCAECGRRIRHDARYMLDASDKAGRVWCSPACQDKAMGWASSRVTAGAKPAFRILHCQREACGKRFRAKRSNAKYCSPRCRASALRSQPRAKDPVVTDNQKSSLQPIEAA